MYNYGHLYHYLVGTIESKTLSDSDKDSTNENTERLMGDTVTAKPLKKQGRNLLDSGFVENIQDNSLPNGDYALRAHVYHSMKKLLPLNVTIVISGASGYIKRCSCSYKASACNRCAHVTDVLLYLDDNIKAYGYLESLVHSP